MRQLLIDRFGCRSSGTLERIGQVYGVTSLHSRRNCSFSCHTGCKHHGLQRRVVVFVLCVAAFDQIAHATRLSHLRLQREVKMAHCPLLVASLLNNLGSRLRMSAHQLRRAAGRAFEAVTAGRDETGKARASFSDENRIGDLLTPESGLLTDEKCSPLLLPNENRLHEERMNRTGGSVHLKANRTSRNPSSSFRGSLATFLCTYRERKTTRGKSS